MVSQIPMSIGELRSNFCDMRDQRDRLKGINKDLVTALEEALNSKPVASTYLGVEGYWLPDDVVTRARAAIAKTKGE